MAVLVGLLSKTRTENGGRTREGRIRGRTNRLDKREERKEGRKQNEERHKEEGHKNDKRLEGTD